jgi:hypothetical protein
MVGFFSDRMFYQTLTCHWCDVIIRNAHALTEDKFDDTMDNFHAEMGRELD